MKLQATVELIKVGSVVEMSNGKVTATVTEETKNGWNLDYVYNGKVRKIQLSKSTLSNPHYMNDVFVIVNEEVALAEALREKGVPETDVQPIIKYMQAYCEGKEGIDVMSIRWNYHIEQYYKSIKESDPLFPTPDRKVVSLEDIQIINYNALCCETYFNMEVVKDARYEGVYQLDLTCSNTTKDGQYINWTSVGSCSICVDDSEELEDKVAIQMERLVNKYFQESNK